MQLPMALAVVSQAVQSIVGSEFGRQGVLIPNSVDCERFYPGPVTTAQPTAVLTAERSQVSTAARSLQSVYQPQAGIGMRRRPGARGP